MTAILNGVIAVFTLALVAYVAWNARPKPRRVTVQSEYRRQRLKQSRRQNVLLVVALLVTPFFAQGSNAARGFYIFLSVVVVVRLILLELEFRRKRRLKAANSVAPQGLSVV